MPATRHPLRRLLTAALCLFAIATLSPAAPAAAGPASARETAPVTDNGTDIGPGLVLQNVGQYAPQAAFMLPLANGSQAWITADAVWLTVSRPGAPLTPPDPLRRLPQRQQRATRGEQVGAAIRFNFSNMNPGATLQPFGPVATKVSHLVGADPNAWHLEVPVWSGVRFRDLYTGIDLVLGGDMATDATHVIPWRLEAQPGADTSVVDIAVAGPSQVIVEDGQWRLGTNVGELVVAMPGVAPAKLAAGTRAATTATPDAVLDNPASLVFSTFLGGDMLDASDSSHALALDEAGNVYVAGETTTADFPVAPGAYDVSAAGAEAFVAKLSADGTQLIYATFLGGEGEDAARAVTVEGSRAYVAGETDSQQFPGVEGETLATAGTTDAFVAVINSEGTGVEYVTLLGGTLEDYANGIAVENGAAYVTGVTYTSSEISAEVPIPFPGANCNSGASDGDLYVAKLDAGGSVTFARCFEEDFEDNGYGIAVRNGVSYVTGETLNLDWTESDMLVVKFDAQGALAASRRISGTDLLLDGYEFGNSIAIGADGALYVAGASASPDFPVTTGAYSGGPYDAVLLKLDPSTLASDYARFVGGSGWDEGHGLAVDHAGGIYLAGITTSANFPVTSGAYDTAYEPGQNDFSDLFIARLHLARSAGDEITYATYLGTTGSELMEGPAVAVDGENRVVVSGRTDSPSFPTTSGAFDRTYGGQADVFVSKLVAGAPPLPPQPVIAITDATVTLSWLAVNENVLGEPVAVDRYLVFQGEQPYFQTTGAGSPAPAYDGPETTFSAPAPPPPGAQFYVVKAVDTAFEQSEGSQRLGAFSFDLVKGQ